MMRLLIIFIVFALMVTAPVSAEYFVLKDGTVLESCSLAPPPQGYACQ